MGEIFRSDSLYCRFCGARVNKRQAIRMISGHEEFVMARRRADGSIRPGFMARKNEYVHPVGCYDRALREGWAASRPRTAKRQREAARQRMGGLPWEVRP